MKSSVCFIVLMVLSLNNVMAQSQVEMNQPQCAEFKKADAVLNEVYKQVLSEYEENKPFIENLKVAQNNWVAFRDAHLKALYSENSANGTVNPLCQCMAIEKLTKERTEQLRQWLEGVEEGDVCGGTIRLKE